MVDICFYKTGKKSRTACVLSTFLKNLHAGSDVSYVQNKIYV